MVYLDGFSGYGGFHLGLERAGFHFHKVYYSEINKYAIANYSYNFPQSIYAGSIDTICESGIIPRLDLFTFGWPCQDNSIAGKRKGQTSGTRSGLLYEAVKIINKFKPRNFIAENVAGLLSVNEGIDIIESLRILTYLNESCPQYDIEMQLLNTRWVLPQNRERLYFVGHLRGSGSKQIFPIGEHENNETASRLPGPEFGIKVRPYSIDNHSGNVVFDIAGIGPTLRSLGGGGGAKTGLYEIDGKIRKLSPIECERQQGLPDDWTRFGIFDEKIIEISSDNRHKLCGNGVTADIVEMIGKKLYKEPLI